MARKPKQVLPRIVTANRLADGIAVFLAADGTWSERVHDASVAPDDAAADLLMARAEADVAACHVVGPYLVDVGGDGGQIIPSVLRERIRALGPSIRADLGKQATKGTDFDVSL